MEFDFDGQTYRASKIPAMKQFHIVRRLGPVLGHIITPQMIEQLRKVFAAGAPKEQAGLDLLAAVFEPLMLGLSELSDEAAEYVINTCLQHCQRALGGDRGWASIMTPGGLLMYQDITATGMITLAVRVMLMEENLGGFFTALRSLPSAPATAA